MKCIILVVTIATCALALPNATDEDLMRRILGLLHKRTVVTRYTSSEQQQIVNAHNKYRRSVVPAASDMQDLKWNKDLANLAQEWANECKSSDLPASEAHGQPANHQQVFPGDKGQNMFWGAASGVIATDSWYEEVNFYDRCAQTCMPGKVCGHYTQLVWAKTTQVGCGYADCPNMNGPKPVVVCNYATAGNFNNLPPYTMSNPGECSNCKPHFCGKNGRPLKYTPSCQCKCTKLFTGDTCEKLNCAGAKDDPECAYTSGVEPGTDQCDLSKGYSMKAGGPTIPEMCPGKCGYCKIKTTPRPPGACKDDKTCKWFSGMSPSAPMCDPKQGYTTRDGKHKLVDLCPVRCGLCKGVKTTPRPPGACKDDKSCKEFPGMSADSQMCDPNEGYTTMDGKHKIVDLCPVSCGRCGGANSRRQILKRLLADLIEKN